MLGWERGTQGKTTAWPLFNTYTSRSGGGAVKGDSNPVS